MVIDFQPTQVAAVHSMDAALMTKNVVTLARIATTFGLPIVLSTVNVAKGQPPTVAELKAVLAESAEIDRTQINAWEDIEFRAAVEATGRRQLVISALWTEACLAYPTLDALREGYEVFPVVDAIGGTSEEAHRAGLRRVEAAGAQPVSWVSVATELQRDWARRDTAVPIREIVVVDRLMKE
ncbi:isochorismatase family protein [Microbacterium deminutum]|uniref:isochorismatase family protein n=1 Tax=Microbacterium deminutum TaxID=344164 RepID=UPI0031E28E4C